MHGVCVQNSSISSPIFAILQSLLHLHRGPGKMAFLHGAHRTGNRCGRDAASQQHWIFVSIFYYYSDKDCVKTQVCLDAYF